jgi:HEAT repeat protein
MDGLLAQLADGDPERRRRAVLDLAERPEALPALVRQLGVEPDRVVRDAICTQLARHDLPAVVDGLIEYLASDDAGLRNAVAGVLSMTPAATSRRVPELLVDPDPDVRILTVMVLGALRLPEVEGWLADLVATDQHANVVSAAIGELAPIAGGRCEAALLAARQRFPDDPYIGFMVTRALAGPNSRRQ